MLRLIAPSRAENLMLKAKLRDEAYAKWLNSDAEQENRPYYAGELTPTETKKTVFAVFFVEK